MLATVDRVAVAVDASGDTYLEFTDMNGQRDAVLLENVIEGQFKRGDTILLTGDPSTGGRTVQTL